MKFSVQILEGKELGKYEIQHEVDTIFRASCVPKRYASTPSNAEKIILIRMNEGWTSDSRNKELTRALGIAIDAYLRQD